MISIIIPVYNAEKYVSDTLDCVLNQTYQDFELILVNDGSKDGTAKIVEEYACRDDRIRVFTQKNSGPSVARNYGINVSRGDWIYFMDSDDTIAANMLECLIANSQSADVVVTGVRRTIEGRQGADSSCDLKLENRYIDTRNHSDFGKFLYETIMSPARGVFFYYIWNKLIRSSIIKDHDIRFNEEMSYGEDFFFMCDVYKSVESIRIISDILYFYHIRGSASLVGRFHKDELQFRNNSYTKMRDLFRHFSVLEASKEELQKHEGLCTLSALNKINSTTCDLDKKGKLAYIKGLTENGRKDYIVLLLDSQRGFKARAKKVIFKLGNEHLIFFLLTYRK